jgi:hypothetical protein
MATRTSSLLSSSRAYRYGGRKEEYAYILKIER